MQAEKVSRATKKHKKIKKMTET